MKRYGRKEPLRIVPRREQSTQLWRMSLEQNRRRIKRRRGSIHRAPTARKQTMTLTVAGMQTNKHKQRMQYKLKERRDPRTTEEEDAVTRIGRPTAKMGSNHEVASEEDEVASAEVKTSEEVRTSEGAKMRNVGNVGLLAIPHLGVSQRWIKKRSATIAEESDTPAQDVTHRESVCTVRLRVIKASLVGSPEHAWHGRLRTPSVPRTM